MVYTKRFDGRKADECRPMEAKVGVVKRAMGSASFRIGKTWAYAAVYAPKALFPKFLKDPETGVLKCNYNMLAFSGSGERVRPGPSRRSKEISMVTEKALTPFVDLKMFPGGSAEVFIELIQTDAGTRCAGITAASMALADAGISMKDLVTSVAVGVIENKIFVDVNKEEEDYEKGMADIAVAVSTRTKKISLLQLDGFVTRAQLKEALEVAFKTCQEIKKIQVKALKENYKVGK